MKGFLLGLSISLAFIVGCVSSPYVVRSSQAQSSAAKNAQRWEYTCIKETWSQLKNANKLGAQGWEMIVKEEGQGIMSGIACFKRPLS